MAVDEENGRFRFFIPSRGPSEPVIGDGREALVNRLSRFGERRERGSGLAESIWATVDAYESECIAAGEIACSWQKDDDGAYPQLPDCRRCDRSIFCPPCFYA